MSTVATYPAGLIPAGYEKLSVSTTVLKLTVPAGSVRAEFAVETNGIRYRIDGVHPTSTDGMPVLKDTTFELYGNLALRAFRVIRSDGNDATVHVNYFKEIGTVNLPISSPSPSSSESPSASESE